MKPIFKVSLLAATVLLAVGCQKEEAQEPATQVEQAQSEQSQTDSAVVYTTDDEKAAYALGASFSTFMLTNLEEPAKLGIDLDKDIVLKAVEDTFADKSTMTKEEAEQALQGLQQRVQEKATAQAAEKAEKAKAEGEAFRAEFAKQDGVKSTESGLLYKVEKEGDGISPKATDTVVVNYEGTLTDGTKFDSSYDRNEPATFPLNRVIPGWTEVVQLMKVGSKVQVVIPPELAYGEQATPTIPGNSTLVFEIELMSVQSQETAPAAPAAQ